MLLEWIIVEESFPSIFQEFEEESKDHFHDDVFDNILGSFGTDSDRRDCHPNSSDEKEERSEKGSCYNRNKDNNQQYKRYLAC